MPSEDEIFRTARKIEELETKGDFESSKELNALFRDLHKNPELEYGVVKQTYKDAGRNWDANWLELKPSAWKSLTPESKNAVNSMVAGIDTLSGRGESDELRRTLADGLQNLYKLGGLAAVEAFVHRFNAQSDDCLLTMRESKEMLSMLKGEKDSGKNVIDSVWSVTLLNKTSGEPIDMNTIGLSAGGQRKDRAKERAQP